MCSVLSFYQKYLRVLGSLSETTLKGSSSTSHGPSRDCPHLRDPAGDVSSGASQCNEKGIQFNQQQEDMLKTSNRLEV